MHRTIRITLAVAMMSLALGVKGATAASPTGRRVNWPCSGCITYIPPTYVAGQPTTVLVALHGDEGDPSGIESVWEPIAKQNNAILIAPKCPASLGCPGSWWGWLEGTGKYDDSWIGTQVATVAHSYTLDTAHEYLISWSGGSDYLGWYALSHASQYQAALFVVGGVPYHPGCPAKKQAAYFLMGSNDDRYLSGQPSQVKAIYSGCNDTTKLVVLPGADHQGTADALTTKGYAAKIMKWLLKHS